ncbi:MAG: lipoate--protein ligase [Clostridiales bacterium]|nr:lipoate--protein ligase [Clostridiales bacterium]
MKIYINENTDPYFNLASEEYLLEHSDGDIFLLWRNAPAVIIGKNQNAFAEINLDFARENGIKVVRRLTGGGAVFHDLGNVNFTFISPMDGELAKGMRAGGLDFEHFTRPVVEALASLGVAAELSGRNDIIAATSDGDKRKISGNAQCVYNTTDGKVKTMHHGTLLFSADMSYMQGALNVDADKLKSKGIKSVRSRVANIIDLIPDEKLSFAESVTDFMRYIVDYITARYDVPAEIFDPETIAGIELLSQNKYSTDEWNLQRFGSFETKLKHRFEFGTVEADLDVREGKISALHISGDFFGVRDVGIIANELIGVGYSTDEVAEFLCKLDIGEYISGALPDEIARFICGSIKN